MDLVEIARSILYAAAAAAAAYAAVRIKLRLLWQRTRDLQAAIDRAHARIDEHLEPVRRPR